jgi:hypothetical protein
MRWGWTLRRRKRSRARLRLLPALALAMSSGHAASAKDLNLLVRYLVPVFLSQDFATTCGAMDPGFLSNLADGFKAVDVFSAQMKNDVTARLSEQEAATVVLVAANTALQAARRQMEKLSREYPKIDPGPLDQWCRDAARPYILEVMRKDQREHNAFERIINEAKR